MSKYMAQVEKLMGLFKRLHFDKIDRLDNEAVDELAKLSSTTGTSWAKEVPNHHIPRPSTSGWFEVSYVSV